MDGFNAKKTFYKNTPQLRFKERIYNKIVHEFIAKFYSDEYVKYLKKNTKMNFENVLDVGAKYGSLVKEFEKKGIKALGIEADEKCVQLAVTKHMKWTYFDENYQTDQKYDLICLPQIIYYFPDTYSILNFVKKLLAPHGLVFIATYNIDSDVFKTKFKDNLTTCNMLLSRKEYASLNEKIGLELLNWTNYTSNISLDFALKNNNITSFLKYRLGLRKGIFEDPNGFFAFLLLKNNDLQ
jgi:2-polyprenyl-3-methyl-5-hydroxy-6-metoxy-1,4-benzoquinol methylase